MQVKAHIFSFLQKTEQKLFSRGKRLGTIFTFHRIAEHAIDHYTITEKGFRTMIQSLMENKSVSFQRIADLPTIPAGGNLFITFDDIYDDVYQIAYPVLVENKIPFTVFVSAELIDKPGYITSDHLRQLAACPLCTVGGHGMSHCSLRGCEKGEEKGSSFYEMNQSRYALSLITGKPVDFFAYPFGSIYACSFRNRREIIKAGYTYGFSMLETDVYEAHLKRRNFIPRINVNESNYEKLIQQIEEAYGRF